MSSNKRIVSVSLNAVKALATSENSMVMYRQKISQICVVGNVLSVSEHTTKLNYIITDYTCDSMEVTLWRNNGGGPDSEQTRTGGMVDVPVVMEQTYVKVFGQPRKDQDGKVFIVAFNIQPLVNLNDLSLHILEVIQHAKDLKLMKISAEMESQNGGGGQLSTTNGGDQMKGGQNTSGFNNIQQMIMNLVRENTTDVGIHLDEICDSLRSVTKDQVKQAVDFLLNEGHIYEALDEVHFKSSD